MKKNWLPISKSKLARLNQPGAYVSLLLFLIIAVAAGITWYTSQPELPMFYTLARPEQALAHKSMVFLFPSLSFIILIVNSTLLLSLRDRQQLISQLFVWSSAIVHLLLLTAVLRILLITI